MAKRKRRAFTKEFKAQAVRIVRESGKSVTAVASLATYPVGRTPLEIHDRQNADVAWLDLVEKRVGKSAEEATTNGTTEDHRGFGMVLNGRQAPIDSLRKEDPSPGFSSS